MPKYVFRKGYAKVPPIAVTGTVPIQLMKMQAKANEWYGASGIRSDIRQRFVRAGLRQAIIVPVTTGYPHLTIDIDRVDYRHKQSEVDFYVSQMHYSHSPGSPRIFFEERHGVFVSHSDLSEIPSLVPKLNRWLQSAELPFRIQDMSVPSLTVSEMPEKQKTMPVELEKQTLPEFFEKAEKTTETALPQVEAVYFAGPKEKQEEKADSDTSEAEQVKKDDEDLASAVGKPKEEQSGTMAPSEEELKMKTEKPSLPSVLKGEESSFLSAKQSRISEEEKMLRILESMKELALEEASRAKHMKRKKGAGRYVMSQDLDLFSMEAIGFDEVRKVLEASPLKASPEKAQVRVYSAINKCSPWMSKEHLIPVKDRLIERFSIWKRESKAFESDFNKAKNFAIAGRRARKLLAMAQESVVPELARYTIMDFVPEGEVIDKDDPVEMVLLKNAAALSKTVFTLHIMEFRVTEIHECIYMLLEFIRIVGGQRSFFMAIAVGRILDMRRLWSEIPLENRLTEGRKEFDLEKIEEKFWFLEQFWAEKISFFSEHKESALQLLRYWMEFSKDEFIELSQKVLPMFDRFKTYNELPLPVLERVLEKFLEEREKKKKEAKSEVKKKPKKKKRAAAARSDS
ncbi:MAG: hypothetical protein MI784_06920 [Cytophagales bacterium]|nr:hypothetical protein [Cytophagales bacterium]